MTREDNPRPRAMQWLPAALFLLVLPVEYFQVVPIGKTSSVFWMRVADVIFATVIVVYAFELRRTIRARRLAAITGCAADTRAPDTTNAP